MDVETTDGERDVARLVAKLREFISKVESETPGRRAMIYTGWNFWNTSFGGSDAFAGHPLWIAEYNNQSVPSLPKGWNRWSVWQHSSKGRVTGITGNVDLDRLNGDAAALLAITL